MLADRAKVYLEGSKRSGAHFLLSKGDVVFNRSCSEADLPLALRYGNPENWIRSGACGVRL